jgi:hypothetical protein
MEKRNDEHATLRTSSLTTYAPLVNLKGFSAE